MRLLVVTSSFHPAIGGAESYAYAISSALAQRGHQVVVITDHPDELTQPVSGDPVGVQVNRFSGYRDLLSDPSKIFWEQMAYSLFPEVAAVLDGFTPDAVLTNSLDAAVVGKTIALHLRVPWVATSHEQAPEREPLGEARMQVVYQVLSPDLVLAGSWFYANRARMYQAPCEIVYHGIDTNMFTPGPNRGQTRSRYGIGEEEVLLVCAGRLKERKGIREAVEAFAIVHRQFPSARLLVTGTVNSGSLEYADNLQARITQPDIVGTVTIDRTVPYPGMPSILGAADIVLQPSLEEGLGLAVLEAMSVARPVVTTAIPGIQEILTVDGIAEVVGPADVEATAAAVYRLLTNPERAVEMGQRARQHVIDHFSWISMAERTEQLLGELVSRQTYY